MYTYTQLLEEGYDELGDSSSRAKRMLTKGINEGLTMFRSILKQYWTEETRQFTIVKNQTRYQLPESAIRASELVVFVDDIKYWVDVIYDDQEWDILTAQERHSNIPVIMRLVGSDEFEIFPIPDTTYENGGKIKFQGKGRPLSVEDFSDGKVSVEHGSNIVGHSAGGFASQMVGRSLIVPDDTSDKSAYKIIEFTDSSNIKIENAFAGSTNSSADFIIGEVPNIPEEFHLSLLDRGIWRYYRSRKDQNTAVGYKDSYDEAVGVARSLYSGADMSNVIPSKKQRRRVAGYNTMLGKPGAVDE